MTTDRQLIDSESLQVRHVEALVRIVGLLSGLRADLVVPTASKDEQRLRDEARDKVDEA